MIVQQLHHIQQQHGFLPEHELRMLAERSGVHLYRIQELSSFFPHFRTSPPPELEIAVCRDVSCRLRDSCQLQQELEETLGKQSGERVQVEGVSCLGRCDLAPAVRITHAAESRNYCQRDANALRDIIDQTLGDAPPDPDLDIATHHDVAWKIDVYAQQPKLAPYSTVREFINAKDRGPARERVIQALHTAGLLGMGGAGGRTYKKWNDVLHAKGDIKYAVCNADESEPGTFKDRELLLRTPHLVLEGLILGALIVGATRAYVYIRHEYEEQIHAIRDEIKRAEQLGVCGKNILGSGVDLSVDVFISPGGYICGEQTALIEVMEDKRAEPRNRPPELQTNGLWDCPTLLNNVETLAWAPAIVLKQDGQWYADQGRREYRGLRLFSVSGDVAKPGVYETPIGTTLRELIEQFAGGMRDGKPLKAIALSGPSGGFLPRQLPLKFLSPRFVEELASDQESYDLLDMELDVNVARKMDVMLGAGIIAFNEDADMVAAAASASRFFRNESCGKCVPCRIGTQKIAELLNALENDAENANALFAANAATNVRSLLDDLSETMKLTAICGLGMVASNPVYSLLNHFPDEIHNYLTGGDSSREPQSRARHKD